MNDDTTSFDWASRRAWQVHHAAIDLLVSEPPGAVAVAFLGDALELTVSSEGIGFDGSITEGCDDDDAVDRVCAEASKMIYAQAAAAFERLRHDAHLRQAFDDDLIHIRIRASRVDIDTVAVVPDHVPEEW